jgi:hypothetical protein
MKFIYQTIKDLLERLPGSKKKPPQDKNPRGINSVRSYVKTVQSRGIFVLNNQGSVWESEDRNAPLQELGFYPSILSGIRICRSGES